MSTAMDTELEALLSGEASELHGVCVICHPGPIVPAGALAVCGYRFKTAEPITDGAGRHKCAACLTRRFWPCGHP